MTKTVLITGCSSGIGAATAQVFGRAGWNVVATMRQPECGSSQPFGNFCVLPLDVTDQRSVDAAVAAAMATFGAIDVLVNNAGYGLFGPFELASAEAIAHQFETNVTGIFNVTRAVVPIMRAQRSGVIVNVASIGGLAAFPMNSLYNATKFAVVGFSESLNFELLPFGIHVKVVAPGGVSTDFSTRSVVQTYDGDAGVYEPILDQIKAGFDERRDDFCSPEAVGQVILTAATDGRTKTRYVVGADAQNLVAMRAAASDEQYVGNIQKLFGLET